MDGGVIHRHQGLRRSLGSEKDAELGFNSQDTPVEVDAWEKALPSRCWPETPEGAAVSPHPAPTQLVTVGAEGTYQGWGIDDGDVIAKLKSPTNASHTDGQEQDPTLNLRREGRTQSN